MSRRTRYSKRLRSEDEAIWKRVAETVKPLAEAHPLTVPGVDPSPVEPRGQDGEPRTIPPIPRPAPRGPATMPGRKPVATASPKGWSEVQRLDARTTRRIARGRTRIEGRIDLHGMTRDDAHARLLDFLMMSRALGRRTVLVITGKGFAGEGVLRREVPLWLSSPAFRPMIVGVEQASLAHGGEGALYVRLGRLG